MATAPSCSQTTRRGGPRGNQLTPVATAAEMVEIVWQLPGTADFRRNCAQLTVRYLGGDESLIGEVHANRRAQEELAVTQPDHPARAFGEAVEQTSSATPIANDSSRCQKFSIADVGISMDTRTSNWFDFPRQTASASATSYR